MAIKQRSVIPGGVCEFDAPSFHQWLHHETEARQADIRGWLAPMMPILAALKIVLRVLRESGKSVPLVAYRGAFQQMPAERMASILSSALPLPPEMIAPA